MIILGLLALLQLVLLAGVALLPKMSTPAAVDLSAFQVIAWLFPLNELVTLGAVVVAGVVMTCTYAAVNFVINKVRGSG